MIRHRFVGGIVLAAAAFAACGREPAQSQPVRTETTAGPATVETSDDPPPPSTAPTTAEEPANAEGFADIFRDVIESIDYPGYSSSQDLFDKTDAVVVGRIDAAGIRAGRDFFSLPQPQPEDEIVYSTFYLPIEVTHVIRDDAANPIGDEVVMEFFLPAIGLDGVRRLAPDGRRVIVAVVDTSDSGEPGTVRDNGELPPGEHPYFAAPEGLVIERPGGGYISPAHKVFADEALNEMKSFDALIRALVAIE